MQYTIIFCNTQQRAATHCNGPLPHDSRSAIPYEKSVQFCNKNSVSLWSCQVRFISVRVCVPTSHWHPVTLRNSGKLIIIPGQTTGINVYCENRRERTYHAERVGDGTEKRVQECRLTQLFCNTHCNTLQHTATHLHRRYVKTERMLRSVVQRNTLQRSATHFSTLQHTLGAESVSNGSAKRYNTL